MALNPADDALIAQLKSMMPEGVIGSLPDVYLEEPRGILHGQGKILARPRTTEQVSLIVKAAQDAKVGIVPYGGGTGLVGGQVMLDGPAPLVISLERMAKISSVYPQENVLITQAGATLAAVQEAADAHDRLYPLSLASEGSARIGGTLATNAGGTAVLRYGSARDLCLGLEVVLPDGSVWNGLRRLRKDNTGYDLRHLIIGAEGTLGIITAASLKLFSKPAHVGTAMIAMSGPAAALSLLSLARARFGETITSFEIMHRQGFEFLREKMPQVRLPFEDAPEWSVLIELGLPEGMDPKEALGTLFLSGHDLGLVQDGVIAQSNAQSDAFWKVRETIPLANKMIGAISSHDISVPLGAIAEFIEKARVRLAKIGDYRINCFGHLGDGNLHFNVFPLHGETRADHADKRECIKDAVHEIVHVLGGSFSAEHGVGRLKTGDLERYGDPAKLAAMRSIKTALDPHGIMNPGAVLR